jgi:hypothetical protein
MVDVPYSFELVLAEQRTNPELFEQHMHKESVIKLSANIVVCYQRIRS